VDPPSIEKRRARRVFEQRQGAVFGQRRGRVVTRPESKREAALAALREGLPVEVAAERAGVSASTVRGWIRKGRRDPASEFGVFVVEPAVKVDGAMTFEELEGHLAEAIRRKKNVAAMTLWARLHASESVPAGADPFGEFDPR
jgi:transposase-like protein